MPPETRPKSSGTLEKRAPGAGTIVSIRNDLALDKQNGGWLLRFHRCTLYIIYMYIWNFQSWSNISSWSVVHYSSVNWCLHHWPVKDDANTPRSAQSGWSAVCSLQSVFWGDRLFSRLRLKKSSPLLPRIEWAGSNFLVFSKGPLTSPTLQGSSYKPRATPTES